MLNPFHIGLPHLSCDLTTSLAIVVNVRTAATLSYYWTWNSLKSCSACLDTTKSLKTYFKLYFSLFYMTFATSGLHTLGLSCTNMHTWPDQLHKQSTETLRLSLFYAAIWMLWILNLAHWNRWWNNCSCSPNLFMYKQTKLSSTYYVRRAKTNVV